MSLYGTPGGQPNNTSPFQGTTPGNAAVGQNLPGIPPNMSIMAAISAGLLPINAMITNFGIPRHTAGESIGASVAGNGADGAQNSAANGGSLNVDQTGNGASAGGSNTSQTNGTGNASVECTVDMPASVAQAGLQSPVNYVG